MTRYAFQYILDYIPTEISHCLTQTEKKKIERLDKRKRRFVRKNCSPLKRTKLEK